MVSGKPRMLDLFCGGGGIACGYARAGFEVVGVDNKPQPHYLLSGAVEFIEADALEYVREHCHEYDAIHASPPCQGYSCMRHLPWLKGREYPMLIAQTRELLERTGKPWVIEKVEGAWKHMKGSVMLCGTMFGLKVYRHRLFLSNQWLWQSPHTSHVRDGTAGEDRNRRHAGLPKVIGVACKPRGTPLNGLRSDQRQSCVAGHFAGVAAARVAMGIDWMTRDELCQAIPPAYTEFVGKQLMDRLAP